MTPRLRFLLEQANPDGPLWDVGCDHGYLGELALQKKIRPVYFVDAAAHVMSELKRKLSRQYVDAKFLHLRGQDIDQVVSGSFVMAGFGGDQMAEILEILFQKQLVKNCRFILSPHKDEEKIRSLVISGLSKTAELEFTERKKKRPVFIFQSSL